MPLLVVISIDHYGKTFYISFAFLPNQTEKLYKWALDCVKKLFTSLNTPIIVIGLGAISTDCDQGL